MATINKDTPCLFHHHRNPESPSRVSDRHPERRGLRVTGRARRSAGFALFAYVIMPEHLHVLADGILQASETLRYINGILSRRVIGYLKEGGFTTSLEKLRGAPRGRGHEYSLVDHHSNVLPVFSKRFFMQKVNYIDLNPVRPGVVARAEDYRWSSARCWSGRRVEDEPLLMDLDRVVWRRPR
ncbi:MAG TPA: hypothetical protein VMG63_20855 [Terriglobia bacterium]|nr:hypothetical protein [Terriglobia bacterium]